MGKERREKRSSALSDLAAFRIVHYEDGTLMFFNLAVALISMNRAHAERRAHGTGRPGAPQSAPSLRSFSLLDASFGAVTAVVRVPNYR